MDINNQLKNLRESLISTIAKKATNPIELGIITSDDVYIESVHNNDVKYRNSMKEKTIYTDTLDLFSVDALYSIYKALPEDTDILSSRDSISELSYIDNKALESLLKDTYIKYLKNTINNLLLTIKNTSNYDF